MFLSVYNAECIPFDEHPYISRMQPSVFIQRLCCFVRLFIILSKDARSSYKNFSSWIRLIRRVIIKLRDILQLELSPNSGAPYMSHSILISSRNESRSTWLSLSIPFIKVALEWHSSELQHISRNWSASTHHVLRLASYNSFELIKDQFIIQYMREVSISS